MHEVVQVFSSLGFEINFKPGKTEAFLVFRGKKAAVHTQRIRDAGSVIRFACGEHERELRIVQNYVHLGSSLAADNFANADVQRRVSTAMQSYAPIATSVFGNSIFTMKARYDLAKSLVFSRLLYNVHIWSVVPAWAVKKLNGPYMRALRRILGCVRYKRVETTDHQVRRAVGAPSLECVIAQQRLHYLVQALTSPASTLRALLACTSQAGETLPWVQSVVQDMRNIKRFHASKLQELGDPVDQWENWVNFITYYQTEWTSLIKSYVFYHSCCDKAGTRAQETSDTSSLLACSACAGVGRQVAFTNERALAMHRRRCHCSRSTLKSYIGADAVCPVCKVSFSTRLRCITHLTDQRR